MKKEILKEIIRCGTLAPSGDNMQQWHIEVKENGFTLAASPVKGDFFDVLNSASFASCGAFLENVRIASLNFGYKPIIKFDKTKSLKVADVRFRKAVKDSSLFSCIAKRACLREKFTKEKLPEGFYSDIKHSFDTIP